MKMRMPSKIAVDVEEDRMGNIIAKPVSAKYAKAFAKVRKENGGGSGDDAFFQEGGAAQEFRSEHLNARQRKDLDGGYGVRLKVDPWTVGHWYGYDAHTVAESAGVMGESRNAHLVRWKIEFGARLGPSTNLEAQLKRAGAEEYRLFKFRGKWKVTFALPKGVDAKKIEYDAQIVAESTGSVLRQRSYLSEAVKPLGTRLKFTVRGKGKNAKYYFTDKKRGVEWRISKAGDAWTAYVREPGASFKEYRKWAMALDIGLGRDTASGVAKYIEKAVSK